MRALRRRATKCEAASVAARLKAVDLELVNLVGRTDCMTLKEAGDLAAMQRKIRRLWRQIEIDWRFSQ
jgi:hypothetical protein